MTMQEIHGFCLTKCLHIFYILGNFLVSKEPPHRPILLDFGLTKSLSSSMKQALAKMFLASVEVSMLLCPKGNISDGKKLSMIRVTLTVTLIAESAKPFSASVTHS